MLQAVWTIPTERSVEIMRVRRFDVRMYTLYRYQICNVICETVPDGGANSVILAQLFYMSVIVFMVNTAQVVTNMFP